MAESHRKYDSPPLLTKVIIENCTLPVNEGTGKESRRWGPVDFAVLEYMADLGLCVRGGHIKA